MTQGTEPDREPSRPEGIYRRQALEAHAHTRVDSELLRLSPEWSRWTYWALLWVVTVGLLFCALGTINEYAAGPAVVRVEGKSEVTVDVAGVVTSVEVEPGQRVAAGQVLVRLQAQEERTALERIEREFELQLVRVLRDPSDQAARQVLTTLRAEREQAQARREARSIRAAHAGVVNDLRVRPAQYVQPGESVASLMDENARASLVALLPGSSRPFLRPGKSLRVELDGFQYEYRDLVIDYVSDQIVGPAETRRYLGREIADALRLDGPQVLVRAHLPASTFRRDGQRFTYVDGMTARAEARLRAESILVMLVPGLKALWSHDTD
jgi:multidrug efflux pump subunit AcrA (membrane-fusion protein)